jgi:glycosyltransferase involved in cell wall biosynthesis
MRSAIGRMSCLVVQVLVEQGHTVTVIRTESTKFLIEVAHPFPCDTIIWTEKSKVRKAALEADAIIYQVGNSFEYHCGCLFWMEKLPGIVCLHDYFLGNLFMGWSAEHPASEAAEVLKRLYDKKYEEYFCYSDSVSFIEGTCKTMPMTEWVASMADGVIVHSAWDRLRLDDACLGPVAVIPLAYAIPKQHQVQDKDLAEDKLTVVTIGHVNPNKRARSVIEAIGKSKELRDKVAYRLVGAVEPDVAVKLLALAKERGVRLDITGEVDDETLVQELINADMVCCLRWPALESASASTIEAMLYGKATLVTDTGFYSELPVDCVLKISPEKEVGDIRNALERLSNDISFRRNLGERAASYAVERFSPKNYSIELIGMCHLVNQFKVSRQALITLVSKLDNWSEGTHKVKLSLADTEKIINIFQVGFGKQKDEVTTNQRSTKFFAKYPSRLLNAFYRELASRPKIFNYIKELMKSNATLRRVALKIMAVIAAVGINSNHNQAEQNIKFKKRL